MDFLVVSPGRIRMSDYLKLPIFEETGYVVLDSYDQSADPAEWNDIEYVDWKSSGETRFAPLASAYGDLECDGFWNHTPPKTDKDGVWVPANADRAPRLVALTPRSVTARCVPLRWATAWLAWAKLRSFPRPSASARVRPRTAASPANDARVALIDSPLCLRPTRRSTRLKCRRSALRLLMKP